MALVLRLLAALAVMLPPATATATATKETSVPDDLFGRRAAMIERLKAEIHSLSESETKKRFQEIAALQLPAPPRQSKIDHMGVLFMENHAYVFLC